MGITYIYAMLQSRLFYNVLRVALQKSKVAETKPHPSYYGNYYNEDNTVPNLRINRVFSRYDENLGPKLNMIT